VVPVTVLARVYIVCRAFLGIVVVLPAAHRVRILVLVVAGVLDTEHLFAASFLVVAGVFDIGRLVIPVVVVAPARDVLPAFQVRRRRL